jgi:hypothetical protein
MHISSEAYEIDECVLDAPSDMLRRDSPSVLELATIASAGHSAHLNDRD